MKNVKVNIDLESKSVKIVTDQVLSLTQELRIYRKELQLIDTSTKEGAEKFNLLAKTMNDTDDAIKKVNVRSRDFFAALGTFPGLLGNVGRSVDGVVDAFKIFGDLKLDKLKEQIGQSKDDFKDIAGTIGRLTGATKIYEGTLTKLGTTSKTASIGTRLFAGALAAIPIFALITGLTLLINNFDKIINDRNE